ncbi:uncharacterized protein LOC9658317 [Selaginella moellendorffii]|nr:uncharacterized protein LOC9658317 [Selaginella moellendorffii]|eukprot:XP_002981122.2 uncharacterized protein LOC9658317 [Selaginella moellendorffii]
MKCHFYQICCFQIVMALAPVTCIVLVLLAAVNATRVDNEADTIFAGGVDATHDPRYVSTILENKALSSVVGETYCCLRNGWGCMQECEKGKNYQCCLKNGFGCMQNCETSKKYSCCLKNGFGCLWKCEDGVEHYCCERNGFGCTKMCPKTVTTGNL